MYVRTYICIYVYSLYVCTYVCMYSVCMYISIHAYISESIVVLSM